MLRKKPEVQPLSEETVATSSHEPETAAPQEPRPVPVPQPLVTIPPQASSEIVRLHNELVNRHQILESSKRAFADFIRATKIILNVPTNEAWDIAEDASFFRKLTEEEATKRLAGVQQ